jgi:hypothetical protein
MGILAMLDLGLKVIDRLGLGTEKVIGFYNGVKQLHPNDVPEKTDAEIIAQAKGVFEGNISDIEASLAALRSTEN